MCCTRTEIQTPDPSISLYKLKLSKPRATKNPSIPENTNSVEDCTHDRTPHTTCISDDDQLRRVEDEDAEAKRETRRITDKLQQANERLTQAKETCKRCDEDLAKIQASLNTNQFINRLLPIRLIKSILVAEKPIK